MKIHTEYRKNAPLFMWRIFQRKEKLTAEVKSFPRGRMGWIWTSGIQESKSCALPLGHHSIYRVTKFATLYSVVWWNWYHIRFWLLYFQSESEYHIHADFLSAVSFSFLWKMRHIKSGAFFLYSVWIFMLFLTFHVFYGKILG